MHLTVIAKRPEPGRVKTRLCPPLTPHEAAQVAVAALGDTLDEVAHHAVRLGCRPVVLFDGEPGEWIPHPFVGVPQRGGDLGDRLANGFADLGPGVIVGMDTPAACRWLPAVVASVRAGRDCVGLAADGGYWVIGLGAIDRRVFDNVPMSASNTGLAQLTALHRLGRGVHLAPMARDLDVIEDLVAVADPQAPGRLGPLAAALLRSHGLAG